MIWLRTLLFALTFVAIMLVVGYEERTLARRFGEDYAAYRAAVGRWLPRSLRPYDQAPTADPRR